MKILSILGLVFTLIFMSAGLVNSAPSWQIETVVQPHYFEDMGPDFMDMKNQIAPAVAYGGDGLFFSRYNGTVWTHETIDDSGNVGLFTKLRYDSGGHAHIAYSDWSQNGPYYGVKYAYQIAENWDVREIPITQFNTTRFSLALDSNDLPWILYFNSVDDVLTLIHGDGAGGWSKQTLFQTSENISRLDLEMDGDNPVFSYIQGTELKIGYKTATGYEFIPVEADPVSISALDMEIDSNGHAHICYQNANRTEVKYITFSPGGWPGVPETVESGAGYVGFSSSLALDPNTGNPVISFVNQPDDVALKLAVHDGTSWQVNTIAMTEYIFLTTSIGVSTNGDIYISYYDGEFNELINALIHAGQPTFTTVDSNARYTAPVISTANTSGNQAIVYRNIHKHRFEISRPYLEGRRSSVIPDIEPNSQAISVAARLSGQVGVVWTAASQTLTTTGYLTYTQETDTGWQTESINSEQIPFNGKTKLKIDENKNPHILYLTDVPSLRYATREGSQWKTADVFLGQAKNFSMSLGHVDTKFFVFSDSENNLHFAQTIDAVTWESNIVDTDATPGGSSMIQTDGIGRPSIMHMDPDTGHLRHFWRNRAQWHDESITEISYYPNFYFDYVVTNTDRYILAWWDVVDNTIKVGTRGTEFLPWEFSVVDDGSAMGYRRSSAPDITITHDPLGRMNITYTDVVYDRIYNARLRESIWYDLGMPSTILDTGVRFQLTRRIHNTLASSLLADEILLLDVYGEYWYWPTWTQNVEIGTVLATGNSVDYMVPLEFDWPEGTGSATGIRFWGGLVSITGSLIDYDMVEFGWEE